MVKTKKGEVTAADMALLLGLAGAISAIITGCGPTVGWQAGVYVNPVNQINEQKELKRYGNSSEFETIARR